MMYKHMHVILIGDTHFATILFPQSVVVVSTRALEIKTIDNIIFYSNVNERAKKKKKTFEKTNACPVHTNNNVYLHKLFESRLFI